MKTHEQRMQQAETTCSAFVRETFRQACLDMTAEQVQQWIRDNADSVPSGIAELISAAHNACVACGAYDEALAHAEFDGD